jgi:hypothetical protein
MTTPRARRVLVVTDRTHPTPALLAAVRERAAAGNVQFRLTVLNPARVEIHLLHPERHDKAAEAEDSLRRALPEIEEAAAGPVIGSVSVRHDPMDAIEESLFSEPIDEIMVSVPEHHLSTWLHQDLEHRLAHLHVPVSVVREEPGAAHPDVHDLD